MTDTKPLSHVASALHLNSFQQEEFERISGLYKRVYNKLLRKWYDFAEHRPKVPLSSSDYRFLERQLRQLQNQPWLSNHDDRLISLFALNEFYRHMKERELCSLALPHPDTSPMTKHNDEVVFYWGYDVKVRDRTLKVPVLGKANTGRFYFFTGSIRAIGVRRNRQGMECVIYYRENAPSATTAQHTDKGWHINEDPIAQSPLNQRLQQAGIGFLVG